MSKERSMDTLPLDGGALCFHFINTVNAWRGVNLHEYLDNYEEVLKWCNKVDILTEKKRKALQDHAAKHPAAAGTALQTLHDAREMLYHFFAAIAADDGRTMDSTILEKFNSTLSDALSHLQFSSTPTGIVPGWKENKTDLLAPLWIVMQSAWEILTLEDHGRIKECEACGWVFMDHTKNNKKRWCSHLTCGSIEKSKRYYHRKKANKET